MIEFEEVRLLQDERRSYVERLENYTYTTNLRAPLENVIAALDKKILELLGIKLENGQA